MKTKCILRGAQEVGGSWAGTSPVAIRWLVRFFFLQVRFKFIDLYSIEETPLIDMSNARTHLNGDLRNSQREFHPRRDELLPLRGVKLLFELEPHADCRGHVARLRKRANVGNLHCEKAQRANRRTHTHSPADNTRSRAALLDGLLAEKTDIPKDYTMTQFESMSIDRLRGHSSLRVTTHASLSSSDFTFYATDDSVLGTETNLCQERP